MLNIFIDRRQWYEDDDIHDGRDNKFSWDEIFSIYSKEDIFLSFSVYPDAISLLSGTKGWTRRGLIRSDEQ